MGHGLESVVSIFMTIEEETPTFSGIVEEYVEIEWDAGRVIAGLRTRRPPSTGGVSGVGLLSGMGGGGL